MKIRILILNLTLLARRYITYTAGRVYNTIV